MITKKFGVDFFGEGGALTLPTECVSNDPYATGTHARTHDSGWTISGKIHEDHFLGVSEFFAFHLEHGMVHGNFEGVVKAESEEAFAHFWKHHEPEAWDYSDI